jgi:very-short-patch-repair endonuclease
MDAQIGLIHRRQLAGVGLSRGAVAHRIRTGVLRYVHPSVFIARDARLDEIALRYAALLHVGEDCVLSHGTAAAIWELLPAEPPMLRATVVRRHVRDGPLLTVHRVPSLDSRDVRMRHGFPVTAPARTLIDVAAVSRVHDLAEALARARLRGLVDDGELHAALDRAPMRTGIVDLRRLLQRPEHQLLTRSDLERLLIALLTAAGLPLPLTNVRVNGHEVDAYWPEQKLILEVDSWLYHGSREAFGRDRARDQDHHAHGDRPIRVTDEQLVEQPLYVAARIAEALAQNA